MKKFFSILFASALACMILCSCAENDEDENIYIPIKSGGGINYETAHAIVGTISEEVTLDGGFTNPYRTNLMFTRRGGKIESINVREDQEVKKGEVIAKISGDELEDLITVAEIRLNSAKSTYETLISQHASEEDIEFAKIDLDLEQMDYDALVADREYLELKAPFDGRIVSLAGYREGSYIDKNAVFCTISDSSKTCLTVTDYATQLSNVSFGTKVGIAQGNLTETTGKVVDTLTGEAVIHTPEGERQTVTVTTYVIECDDPNAEFLDLGGITVTFTTVRRDDAVIVPAEAIFEATDDTSGETANFVNVLMNGIKVQTQVTVGITTADGRAEITSGLSGDETLIIR